MDLLQQLGGVSVVGLSGMQLGQGGDFSLVVPYEDHVYIIAPVDDVATTALDPQALALFYQILSSRINDLSLLVSDLTNCWDLLKANWQSAKSGIRKQK